MSFVRTGVAAVVALAVGALLGAYAMDQRNALALEELTRERDGLQQEVQRLRTQIEQLRQVASAKETDAEAREAELARVREEYEARLQEALSQAQAKSEAAEYEAMEEPARAERNPAQAAEENAQAVQMTPEQRSQYRAEYSRRLRERMQGYIDEEMQRTSDPDAQQRLAALREQTDYMVQIMYDIREATDDARRAELQQQLREVRTGVNTLVTEQQDYVLRQVAAQQGIADPQRQQAFVQSLRAAQESPFFRAPLLMWGNVNSGPLQ